jgi:hypothetical protein
MRYVELRIPRCYIVMAGPSPFLPSGDREALGPFQSEDDAIAWVGENLPERVLFTTIPVYGSLRP